MTQPNASRSNSPTRINSNETILNGGIPRELQGGEAGAILEHVREEFDVSRSQVIEAAGVHDGIIESFETVGFPINRRLWEAYVEAMKIRHGISRERTLGLIKGLIKETVYHDDHKRD